MDKDMKCRGMQFEIGKTYRVNSELKLCQNGLHFCQDLCDVFDYYERNGLNRFFEVKSGESVKTDGRKSVASELTIIRELSDLEINRIIYSDCYGNGNGCGDGEGYIYENGNGYGDGYGGYGNGSGDGNGGYDYICRNGNGCGYSNENIQKIAQFKD